MIRMGIKVKIGRKCFMEYLTKLKFNGIKGKTFLFLSYFNFLCLRKKIFWDTSGARSKSQSLVGNNTRPRSRSKLSFKFDVKYSTSFFSSNKIGEREEKKWPVRVKKRLTYLETSFGEKKISRNIYK